MKQTSMLSGFTAAVVTGGASALGEATVRRLASARRQGRHPRP
jgi:NAD(P)-dependent dehydrogenase (short-subunit alcohol dehydrogenase family)